MFEGKELVPLGRGTRQRGGARFGMLLFAWLTLEVSELESDCSILFLLRNILASTLTLLRVGGAVGFARVTYAGGCFLLCACFCLGTDFCLVRVF